MRVYSNSHSPYCHKLLFFLEESGLPYELIPVEFESFDFRSPEFLKVSPGGQIPAIETEFGNVAESTVCMRYLSDRYQLDDLFPRNLEARAEVDFWTEYVNQHIGRYLVSLAWQRHWQPKRGIPTDQHSVVSSLTALDKYLPVVDRHLSNRNFFRSAFVTIADINLMAFMHQSSDARFYFHEWPWIALWHEKMKKRPAWQRVLTLL